MRHKMAFRKLGRNTSHRRALFRNLATNLILCDRIETTLPKAKELKRVADRLITLGKKDSLAARRQAMSFLYAINQSASGNAQKLTAVHKLFTELAPRYVDRHGGYTRVVRTRVRPGDKAEMAVIEFVEGSVQKEVKKKRRTVKRSDKAKNAASTAEAPQETGAES